MSKAELRSEYDKYVEGNLETKKRVLSLFQSMYLKIINKNREKLELTELDKDLNLLFQSIFLKSLDIKNLLDGTSFKDKNNSIDKIIDPFGVWVLIRNIYESVCVFSNTFLNQTDEEKKQIVYKTWIISGLLDRQRFDETDKSPEFRKILADEKEEIDKLLKEIKDTGTFKNYDEDKQSKFLQAIENRKYRFYMEDRRAKSFMGWEDVFLNIGANTDLSGDKYNFLSQVAHPSNTSIRQFEIIFKREEEYLENMLKYAVNFLCGLLGICLADMIKYYPENLADFEEISLIEQIVLDSYNLAYRNTDYSINDSWKAIE